MKSTFEPLVSVVTPVYNSERYLAECIESILAQTYENWEYLLVNNCSSDRSLEIAQRYSQKDARIRIHNNSKFLTMMQNWNHTMRQIPSESKYCKVVHADDWLFPECIARMVELGESHPSVGIVGSYRLEENRVNLDGLPYPSTIVSGKEICRLFLLKGIYVFGSPTSLLIRSDIIQSRQSFYNESNIHADMEVCFDILQSADFGFVHQVLTFTRLHDETNTTLISPLKTDIIEGLKTFIRYGPVYLSNKEYEKYLQNKIRRYHRFLARNVLELTRKEFWEYHKKALKELGISLSISRLAKALLLELLDIRTTRRRIIKGIRSKKLGD